MTTGRLLLKGTIELTSPALIGCGRDDRTDIDVLLDSDGKPFIPATSFIGVLRHFIRGKAHEDDLKRFWGFTSEEKISDKEKERQSTICCDDLLLGDSSKITVRDGIKIDNKKGIVEDKGKYDYELVERGAKFKLNMEVNLSAENRTFCCKMLKTICTALQSERILIGAKTNSGFGKVRLADAKMYEFDYSKKEDVLKWLKGEMIAPVQFKDVTELPVEHKEFVINATFDLKNSLIVRSYPSSPEMPDAVHIQSSGDNVLPGTSLKGAIRARAERILKTLAKQDSLLTELFGNVDPENKSRNSRKGRLRIDEVILPKFMTELQSRTKIDRFTGGVIESALFETMPLFSQPINLNEKVRDVKITIRDCKNYEAGLMLLVLKDLWTGDLAVGGEKSVGRGVFDGCCAEIMWNGRQIRIEKDIAKMPLEDKTELESLVKALVDYQGGIANEG